MIGVEQQADDLRLLIPADIEHLRAARLVAADAAGFDCEETDDLRIAVDELCHCIMQISDGPIALTFSVSTSGVTIEGTAAVSPGMPRPLLHPISDAILRSSTDYFHVETEDARVRFALGKAGARAWA